MGCKNRHKRILRAKSGITGSESDSRSKKKSIKEK
jgi:hypothetical protein